MGRQRKDQNPSMKTSVSEAEGMPAARRFCLPSGLEPQKKKPWHISRHKQTHFYKPSIMAVPSKNPCIACGSQLESTPFRASGCLKEVGWGCSHGKGHPGSQCGCVRGQCRGSRRCSS